MLTGFFSQRLRYLVVAVSALACISLLATHVGPTSAETPDAVAIDALIRNEQVVMQTADIAPAGGWHANAPMSATDVQTWKQGIDKQVSSLYTERRGAKVAAAYHLRADEQQTGTMGEVGGGVHWVHLISLQVSGSTAKAVVDVSKWLTFRYTGKNNEVATATVDRVQRFDYTLVKSQSGWLIDNEDIDFGPGNSGPGGPSTDPKG